ncbi:MAG: VOC family protein [Betaproteobacteria bacterium]|nr:VOC family protein [Betaproteobacteria bacterium]
MPLSHLEHFLIQTADLEKTRDWYVRILGMREGWHPDFKFPVVWLYLGDKDVLHLTPGGKNTSANRKQYLGQQSDDVYGSGVLDHVAFRSSGLPEMLAHLKREGVEFTQRMVSDQGLYQLFLLDPNGVKIELNFANREAIEHGIVPEIKASELAS